MRYYCIFHGQRVNIVATRVEHFPGGVPWKSFAKLIVYRNLVILVFPQQNVLNRYPLIRVHFLFFFRNKGMPSVLKFFLFLFPPAFYIRNLFLLLQILSIFVGANWLFNIPFHGNHRFFIFIRLLLILFLFLFWLSFYLCQQISEYNMNYLWSLRKY